MVFRYFEIPVTFYSQELRDALWDLERACAVSFFKMTTLRATGFVGVARKINTFSRHVPGAKMLSEKVSYWEDLLIRDALDELWAACDFLESTLP